MKATELCGEIGSVQSPRADKEVMEANKMPVEKKNWAEQKKTLCVQVRYPPAMWVPQMR